MTPGHSNDAPVAEFATGASLRNVEAAAYASASDGAASARSSEAARYASIDEFAAHARSVEAAAYASTSDGATGTGPGSVEATVRVISQPRVWICDIPTCRLSRS